MPIIGIPVRYYHLEKENGSLLLMVESVRRTIQKAGGDILVILPIQDVDYVTTSRKDFKPLTSKEKRKINNTLDKCDGLFLPGGYKFTPFDEYILEYAIEKDIPTLAVCLSMQMMSCYQEEINLELNDTNIDHNQIDNPSVHSIKIDKDSKLYQIIQKENIMVNSTHKYHGTQNHIYKTVAYSEDNIIEGIEHPNATFSIGVQWHPERTYSTDVHSKKIIDAFIEEAIKYENRNRKIDRQID